MAAFSLLALCIGLFVVTHTLIWIYVAVAGAITAAIMFAAAVVTR